MAISNWSLQSQRSDPNTSLVKHCEWMRNNGAPCVNIAHDHGECGFDGSGLAGRGTLKRQRSETFPTWWQFGGGNSSNRAACAPLVMTSSCWSLASRSLGGLTRLRTFVCCPEGAARSQAFDFVRVESQFFQNLVVVLSDFRRALCRHFGDIVHLHGTADGELQIPAGALDRHDDVVLPQLRIFDDFAGSVNDAECKVSLIEDFPPVRHRL